MRNHEAALTSELTARSSEMHVGIDVVCVRDVAESVETFGDRYLDRLFTHDEVLYARAGTTVAERLSARFAAKEAALKALGLCHAGVNLRDIEVVRDRSGRCELRFHGHAAELLASRAPLSLALSMSHDGDYAVAAVTVLENPLPTSTTRT